MSTGALIMLDLFKSICTRVRSAWSAKSSKAYSAFELFYGRDKKPHCDKIRRH